MDEFAWWRKALLGRAPDPVAEQPMSGFFKLNVGPDKPAVAVAIWKDGGKLVARVGLTFEEPGDVWAKVCRSPVSYDDYLYFVSNGSWKDHPADAAGVHTRDLKKAAPIY